VAAALAEEIGRLRIPVGEDEIGVTASVGLVYLDENAPDQGAVVAAADRAMYEKKLTSRRRP
jgi:GGDEF domain-containing protein